MATREIRKANRWTTLLIVAVMVLTFLNLIVVTGILVGLIEGAVETNKERYYGDVVISRLLKKERIEKSSTFISMIDNLTEIKGYSIRLLEGGRVEANYKERVRQDEKLDQAGANIAGIDPMNEDKLNGLSKFIVSGKYLEPDDTDEILIGAFLLYDYTPVESPGFQTLKNVKVGSKVRLVIGDVSREVTVKGIIKSKVDELDARVFMVDSALRRLADRNDGNVDEISIKLEAGTDPDKVKQLFINNGMDKYARIQTWEESQPKFLKDIKATFALLGNMIGSIGLAVAAITIFIIIFVNAITRRRYIGILKGIGINSTAIEVSYIIQSLFYAICGIFIGALIVFLFLKPYIYAHPINFPFSDGILVADFGGTMIRALILLVATTVAGFIPARIVVKQNTLDAILGR